MTVTTAGHVFEVLGISTSTHAQQAYLAAEGAVASACRWPAIDPYGMPAPVPEALVQAVVLRTARYLARRESPTGVLGVGDFGPVRIASVDRDIEELEAPWRRVVFG